MIPTLRVRGQGAGITVSYDRRYGNKILRSKIKIFKHRFIDKLWKIKAEKYWCSKGWWGRVIWAKHLLSEVLSMEDIVDSW